MRDLGTEEMVHLNRELVAQLRRHVDASTSLADLPGATKCAFGVSPPGPCGRGGGVRKRGVRLFAEPKNDSKKNIK